MCICMCVAHPTNQTVGCCRYDVRYGSAGFNSYGYQAGCTFVTGTFDEVLADADGSRFLCPPEDDGAIRCFHDLSGQGVCRPQQRIDSMLYEDLFSVDTVCPQSSGG